LHALRRLAQALAGRTTKAQAPEEDWVMNLKRLKKGPFQTFLRRP